MIFFTTFYMITLSSRFHYQKHYFDMLFHLVKEKTGSSKGATILKEWDKYLPLFWQFVPPSEEDTPEASMDYDKAAAGEVTLQSA